VYKDIFQKQAIMRRVLYSLAPIYLFSLYLYGRQVLALTVVVFAVGVGIEYIMERRKGKKVSEAAYVTCALFTLALPPATPLWIAAVGIAFAIFIVKEAFGGFGRNVYNPAISGRVFVWISFAAVFDFSWVEHGTWGRVGEIGVDRVTSATPMTLLSDGESTPELMDLLVGTHGGSIGESSVILIVAAAIYLIATKTAQWRLIVSTFASAGILTAIFYHTGLTPHLPVVPSLLSGSLIFVSVYYATDPITAPNKKSAQWIYGLIIGGVSVVVRGFAGFPEGTSLGILVANTFSSLLDEIMPKANKKTKAKATKRAAAQTA